MRRHADQVDLLVGAPDDRQRQNFAHIGLVAAVQRVAGIKHEQIKLVDVRSLAS